MMKYKSNILIGLISLFILCSFSADIYYYGSSNLSPVLMERAQFENSIRITDPIEMDLTSRVSLFDDMIFVIEQYKGIHVIDNTDATAPLNKYFLNIPGCMDSSIKDNVLYARSAEDLVAIDITDLSNIKVISRVRETFPELGSTSDYYELPYDFQKGVRPENTVIVAWENIED